MEQLFNNDNIIIAYTRAQALSDGVLVDLNQYIPIAESGYKYPVACTETVFNLITKAVNNPNWGNDYEGIVYDILNMSRLGVVRRWETGQEFRVMITGAGSKRWYNLKIECHPGDNAEPVLTIMFPEED